MGTGTTTPNQKAEIVPKKSGKNLQQFFGL